jgi:hypothetical protein
MKKLHLLSLTLAWVCLFSFSSYAQLELGLQGGASTFGGDAYCFEHDKKVVASGAFGAYARYMLNCNFGIRGQYAYLPLKFDETKLEGEKHLSRRISGSNKASDVSLDLSYSPWCGKKLRPYIFGGIGAQISNCNINWGTLQNNPAYTSLIAEDEKAPTVNFTIPIGSGFRYKLSEQLGLTLETGMRLPISDYYDCISKAAGATGDDWYGYGMLGLVYKLKGDPDRDKDGITDKKDVCPDVAGLKQFEGCPDTDNDGIKDSDDRCPGLVGSVAMKGCPDTDGDGVANIDDKCPEVKGLAKLMGCPDRDEDGIADAEDTCPDEKGLEATQGCPDTDNDNIADKDDKCPTEKGSFKLNGCPDSDNDGIADNEDKCPQERGVASNNGCPEKEGEAVANTTVTGAVRDGGLIVSPVKTTDNQPVNPINPSVNTTNAATTATATTQKNAPCSSCNSSNDPIFSTVCNNPKKLSRLGTNPEFGNSHGLTPEGFYEKLKKAYANNKTDKVFLDRIYKAMGYASFADAKPEHFSEVILPMGATGKLGYSTLHKTGCYTLPDTERDRMAFHINAANGCHLHFMKTCGNHFFYCPK